jgi:hypothetical protein
MSRIAILAAAAAVSYGFAPRIAAQQTPPAASATRADSTRMTVVTYISGQSVYVGAGRADGIREGMSLEVLRASAVIATVRVAFLASHSASGSIDSSTALPVVGDSVRYHPVIDAAVIAATPDSASAGSPDVRRRTVGWRRPIRGHIGVRYLTITEPNVSGSPSFTQPSADVYVQATQINGTPISVVVDARARRTIGTQSPSTFDDRTLVYQASISLDHQGSGTRLSLGRQYSAALSSVSLFDGVTAELNRAWWGVGGFGGMEPDAATMNYSSEIRDAGGYVQFHSPPDGPAPWSLTTGAISSRDFGQINREFGFAQLSATTNVVSLFATQEVDLNRGWKRAAGEAAVSPTSTFATVLVRASDALSFQGGVDNRRNVRLYRDLVSPETEFDDAFREGFWAGASYSFPQRIRVGGDARVSRGGVAGNASYYTGSTSLGPFTQIGFEGHLRSTAFRTESATGWLHALSVAVSPIEVLRIEIDGGLRTEHLMDSIVTTSAATLVPLSDVRWIGATVDISLGRWWYLLLSGTRDGSGLDQTNQLYGSLVFRF